MIVPGFALFFCEVVAPSAGLLFCAVLAGKLDSVPGNLGTIEDTTRAIEQVLGA